ncbi:MAG: uridine kinase [Lachnospiraceae bacterium]|nr:uridine kinase [Lachnospiraceae bacterium]
MTDINNIISKIQSINKSGSPVIVAIDGRCGSGKTTLAMKLSEIIDCTVFHMDDFFLRKEQRTSERLKTPGEFVDHERFLEEILIPIKEHRTVYLRRFCHDTFEPGEAEEMAVRPIVIVEGTYSCNVNLKNYYDMTVFMTTDSTTQLERLKRRNPDKYDMFVEKWIPLEEMYFDTFSPKDCFDIVYET